MKLFGLHRLKNYAQRSSNYLAIGNTILLIYVAFRNNFQTSFITIAPITLLVVVAGLFLIGYLDEKLGFLASDIKYHEEKNPYNKEILKKLKKIERRIMK